MMIPSSLMMMRKPWSFSEPTAPAKWSHDCSYYSINTQCSEEEDARRSIELEFLNQLRVKLLLGMVIDDVRCCQLLSVIVDWFYRYIHSFVPSSRVLDADMHHVGDGRKRPSDHHRFCWRFDSFDYGFSIFWQQSMSSSHLRFPTRNTVSSSVRLISYTSSVSVIIVSEQYRVQGGGTEGNVMRMMRVTAGLY